MDEDRFDLGFDASDVMIDFAARRRDRDDLLRLILSLLREEPGSAGLRLIADMIDPAIDTPYRLDLVGKEGNPDKISEGEERVEQLAEIYRAVKNKRNWASTGARKLGISARQVSSYKARVLERIKTEDEIHEFNCREAEYERVCRRIFAEEPDVEVAVIRAMKEIGASDDYVRQFLRNDRANKRKQI